MTERTRHGAPDLDVCVKHCRVALDSGWVSAAQADRVVRILERFNEFVASHDGSAVLDSVGPETVEAFVRAPQPDGTQPSVALQHLRRTALRLLFRSARQSGLSLGDPTLDLVLPPWSPLSTRPLSDEEVALCRSHAYWSLSDSRRAAAWALAEATCRSGELAQIAVADVGLEGGQVWIHDGRTTEPRWGELTDWGAQQIVRRVAELGDDPDQRLVYGGHAGRDAGQVSSCVAISDVLTRAGLASEPDVRPASVAAWRGRCLLAETGRIDLVAKALGMTSLDRAARFIAWDWTDPDQALP